VLVTLSACVTTSGAERQDAAQAVADLDRASKSSLNGALLNSEDIAASRAEASEKWLRGELRALDGLNTDSDIARVQQLIAEADKRELPTVARDAETREAEMIESRASEPAALVERGRWPQALEQVASWTAGSRPNSKALAVKSRTQDLVRDAIRAAAADAAPGAERYLFERMYRWLNGSPKTPEGAEAVNAVIANNATVTWGTSGCAEAQRLELETSANGMPVTLELTLGGCEVRTARGTVSRQSNYIVKVPRQREQQYVAMEERTENVIGQKKDCQQVTKNIATTGPKNYITVSECNTYQTSTPVTRSVEVVKTRMITVIEDEVRSESYPVQTSDSAVGLDARVSIIGDGVSLTKSEHFALEDHDEDYTRQHGPSRSFRSNVELELKQKLSSPLNSLVGRTLREWKNQRAAERLKAARAANDLSTTRARAVEAVALNEQLAPEAVTLVKLDLSAEAFAALVGGFPSVPIHALTSAPALALPEASASLAKEFARLEERHEQVQGTENRDMLVGVGAGLQPTPDKLASGAFALEVQIGYVPTFAAISHLIARIEGDLQIFASKFAQADLALRPELGVRFGPFALSAVGAGGGRLGLNQATLVDDDDGVFGARVYAGYGAHLSLHLGPILLDAMALRLHQLGTTALSPIMMRADGIVGYGISDAVFLFARMRYQAQADLLQMFKVSDRWVSFTVGILLQF